MCGPPGPSLRPYLLAQRGSGRAPQIDGAYLNAKLPTVRPDRLDSRLTVRSIVVPNDGDTSDFAVQDESAPSSSNGAGWGWTQSWREPPIQLTAVNTSAQQNAQYRALPVGHPDRRGRGRLHHHPPGAGGAAQSATGRAPHPWAACRCHRLTSRTDENRPQGLSNNSNVDPAGRYSNPVEVSGLEPPTSTLRTWFSVI